MRRNETQSRSHQISRQHWPQRRQDHEQGEDQGGAQERQERRLAKRPTTKGKLSQKSCSKICSRPKKSECENSRLEHAGRCSTPERSAPKWLETKADEQP